MGLDFWSVKLKNGVTKEDFKNKEEFGLIESYTTYNVEDYIDKDIVDFILKQNDETLYNFCIDTVNYFVSGCPINENSLRDINILADKLNDFIKENPNYKYLNELSNEDVRKIIKYINLVRDNGLIFWCSW